MRGPQVRAARELLGMTQGQLSAATGVSRPTLRDIEAETGDPKRSSLEKVRAYLHRRGIRFVDDPGVIGVPPPPA
jgi:transcriptional regulator with XRE-family HTH domain